MPRPQGLADEWACSPRSRPHHARRTRTADASCGARRGSKVDWFRMPTMHSHERAAQIWPLLTYAASHRQTLTYELVGRLIGVPHFGLAQLLEPIQSYCLIRELPALTS